MEQLSLTLALQMLNKVDPEPISLTKEQRFFAFFVCKDLAELCDTGRAILREISSKGHPLTGLPDDGMITMCQGILKNLYTEKMFIEDARIGTKPDWRAVQEFPKDRSDGASKLYRCLKRNVMEKPGGREICEAVRRRDQDYFEKNFWKIFTDLPSEISKNLVAFKNMISCRYVPDKSKNYVWDFFESLMDLIQNEDDNIKLLPG